jgi:hypothetical protein
MSVHDGQNAHPQPRQATLCNAVGHAQRAIDLARWLRLDAAGVKGANHAKSWKIVAVATALASPLSVNSTTFAAPSDANLQWRLLDDAMMMVCRRNGILRKGRIKMKRLAILAALTLTAVPAFAQEPEPLTAEILAEPFNALYVARRCVVVWKIIVSNLPAGSAALQQAEEALTTALSDVHRWELVRGISASRAEKSQNEVTREYLHAISGLEDSMFRNDARICAGRKP